MIDGRIATKSAYTCRLGLKMQKWVDDCFALYKIDHTEHDQQASADEYVKTSVESEGE